MKQLALEKQYDFYSNNENELLTKFNGKHLVISDDLKVRLLPSQSRRKLLPTEKNTLQHKAIKQANLLLS